MAGLGSGFDGDSYMWSAPLSDHQDGCDVIFSQVVDKNWRYLHFYMALKEVDLTRYITR